MTPTQPAPLDDAGAMAVLDRLREAERDPYGAVRDPQARASIAAEAADTIEALIARATRAEAELAAAREALDLARDYVTTALSQEREAFKGYEHCSDIPSIERDLAQLDAARGEGQ